MVVAIRLETRDHGARRHHYPFKDFSSRNIDVPKIALIALRCRVPEFAIDPGHSSDEAVGFDGAQNCSCSRINLVNLPVSILSDPQRSLGPRESRVAASPGRRNRGDDATGLRIDFLNPIFGDLKEMLAVE